MTAWRRAGTLGGVWLAAASAAAWAAVAAPELPVWNDGERDTWQPGGGLLAVTGPLPAGETELEIAPPGAEEIAATPGPPIPEKYWQDYFGERPAEFLCDPRGLLMPQDGAKFLEFLTDHANDSSIDLFVYVFKGDEEIPGEAREEELPERLFTAHGPAVLIYYHLGEPERSVLYPSPALIDAVPAAEQRRALESSVMQAVAKTSPAEQLEAFLSQMSIRIYWMERMRGRDTSAAPDHDTPAADAATVATSATGKKKSAAWHKWIAPWMDEAQRFGLPAAAVAALLLAAAVALGWWRRRLRYLFPEMVVEPRLGARHAAGVGAVLSFASTAVSPAAQRDQLPDDWRRG